MNKNNIIYQLNLRTFTPDGTIKAAAAMLPHIKGLGVSVIYFAAFFESDDDPTEENWSPRQKQSGIRNPKNPYRIKDYFKIDSEYGTDDDMLEFINKAHSYNLKVMFDLVYMHCGPSAVFLKDNPDFVLRDKKGNILTTEFNFPLINFGNQKLRKYLIENMIYLVRKFDIDGYRCDVGDNVPLDFWSSAAREVKKIKPDFFMLNEGCNADYVKEVFDCNYHFDWSYDVNKVLRGNIPASDLIKLDMNTRKDYGKSGFKFLRSMDNHDIATNEHSSRIDKTLPRRAAECAHLLNFMLDGTPFLHNGNEIADGHELSMFDNRFYKGTNHINWAKALTEDGNSRMNFIRWLTSFRRENPSLQTAEVVWVENSLPDKLLTFTRKLDGKSLFVAINMSDSDVLASANAVIKNSVSEIKKRSAQYIEKSSEIKLSLGQWGFLILSY